MSSKTRRIRSAALAGAVLAVSSSAAYAQIVSLDKGHQLLVNTGLQIWGCDTGASPFDYSGLTGANFNGVMWSFGQAKAGQLSGGQKWGKWVDPNNSTPATALNATENAHYSDLLAIQVGDEQQSDLENPNGVTAGWFAAAHNQNLYTDKLLYINSTFVNNTVNFFNFIGAANPDAISWDAYPFGTTGVYPYNWLGKAQIYRRSALGSYIGASGNAARPYGLYLQTYHGGDGARDPSDLEMRWQQFTAWTIGCTFVDAFSVGGGTSLFQGANMGAPDNPRYTQFAESARQSRNLGPALTRLISYGYGPNIVLGQDLNGATNPVPINWPVFNKTNAPPNQQYLTSVSAQNLGTKNNGHPGDVYVGFFNPLLSSYGDPVGEAYFMATNALGAYLQDPTLVVGDCKQKLTLDFNFGTSGISSLQRISRNTGQLEIINASFNDGGNTTWTATGPGTYRLQLSIDGGTGDLFKYNDATPFVGLNNIAYWDNDGLAAGNSTANGSGLGQSGTWDGSARWYSGSGADTAWAANRDAVFWGTAGSVTLASSQTANSLTFKTTGYTLTGSTLTLAGGMVTVDSGVTATINSAVAGPGGLTKIGLGTLVLGGANSYGNAGTSTTILSGILRVSADASLGVVPANLTAANIVLDGGTLQFGGNFDIANNRGIYLGNSDGTIDTQNFSNPSGYNATAGGFTGPGDLTKLGSGTFFAAATTAGANSSWTGRLILKQGVWKIVASDGLPYNVPNADGLQAGQVTFDGGTLQVGANINVTNANRGWTVAAGGGTIDTQAFGLSWAGAIYGSVATATLTKIGSGTLRLNTNLTNPSTFPGTLAVAGGTLNLNGPNAIGDSATIDLADAAGVLLSLSGNNETIGALSGGGISGGNVSLNAFGLTTGGNGKSTSFGGVISGAGTPTSALTKTGSGTMTLSGANTYTGPTIVNGGKLVLANSLTSSASLTVQNATLEIAANGSRVLDIGPITLAGTAKLNLQDNKLITTSSVASVTTLIQSGRNGGNWSGNGIVTSQTTATTSILTSIGVATAAQVKSIAASETSTWTGQTVTGSDTLVLYTYGGDANLDGKINVDDYGRIDLNVNVPGASGWFNGDFNYDGKVNVDDYGIIDLNVAMQGAPFSTAGSATSVTLLSPVPEPTALLPLALAGAMTMRRRSLRRR